MADFPTSKAEVPFLSELQFCSKVEVSPESPILPNLKLRQRPAPESADFAPVLDTQRSDISPGRFASSRSRYPIKFCKKSRPPLLKKVLQYVFTLYTIEKTSNEKNTRLKFRSKTKDCPTFNFNMGYVDISNPSLSYHSSFRLHATRSKD